MAGPLTFCFLRSNGFIKLSPPPVTSRAEGARVDIGAERAFAEVPGGTVAGEGMARVHVGDFAEMRMLLGLGAHLFGPLDGVGRIVQTPPIMLCLRFEDEMPVYIVIVCRFFVF